MRYFLAGLARRVYIDDRVASILNGVSCLLKSVKDSESQVHVRFLYSMLAYIIHPTF